MSKVLNKLKLVTSKPIEPNIIEKLKGNDYIGWQTALDVLETIFDRIDIEYPEHWLEQCAPKKDKETNVYVEQNPVVFVKCRVTVYYFDEELNKECKIVKEAIGSHTVIGGQNEQQSHYKAASSDALKKAIVLFGFGRQLYRNNKESNFFYYINDDCSYNPAIQLLHSDAYKVIAKIAAERGFSTLSINDLVYEYSNGKYWKITSENIDEFAKWLKMKFEPSVQQMPMPQMTAPKLTAVK